MENPSLSLLPGDMILVGKLLLLFQIHSAVGFRQELFGVLAVLRVDRASHAEREDFFAANFRPGLAGQGAHLLGFFGGGIGCETRRDDHEFVPTHAGDVVIFAAGVLEGLREQAQHAIALEMAKAIIDLLKAVHVGDHHGQG
jgi:hypothetical protein